MKKISIVDFIIITGVISMNFSAFDTEKLDRYAQEAKAKWGNTEVYQEYEKKLPLPFPLSILLPILLYKHFSY